MEITGNTILITGGGSGIGRALAESFQALGNQVIIAGRRQEMLDTTVAANPGMQSVVLDIENPDSIQKAAVQLQRDYPALNAVIHNAGIMRDENLQRNTVEDAEATIGTNLLGPIRLNAALISHLLAQPHATIMTVSSGLAFAPLALTPTYSATKAAIHSYTQSLRYQLKDTAVQVLELIPPYVQTELQGARQASDPHAMPLAEFIAETMGILENNPEAEEITVGRVMAQRTAERSGNYDAFFKSLNDMMYAARGAPQ
jgi:uncharacterized oxidoreductase